MNPIKKNLLSWFEKNKRPLPWRKNKDPYLIWISEVMLQQTTYTAVIPYYNRFIKEFPNLQKLAQAKESDILPLWSGLGYYTRAKNLLKAAKIIQKSKKFPRSYKELSSLPGFGPYTSRAVSSLSFNEPVGVLDGNVIRVFSRFHGLSIKWWISKNRQTLQNLSDKWAQNKSSHINQALMELGSLVCTPKKPLCITCPLQKKCIAFKENIISKLPLAKPKKEFQILHWKPYKIKNKTKFAFIENNYLPFLKTQMVFPGTIQKIKKKPRVYDFKHSITHYKIYVSVQFKPSIKKSTLKWLNPRQIPKKSPSSLIKKVLDTP